VITAQQFVIAAMSIVEAVRRSDRYYREVVNTYFILVKKDQEEKEQPPPSQTK
jgi:hypothetical protein